MIRILFTAVFLLLFTTPLFAQVEVEAEPIDDDTEVFNRVVPVFDPGSHTRPICGMAFTSDNSKLVTVGEDFTIQVWSVVTGERLDILRLYPYGREQGGNHADWDVAAVSKDGRYVALGGGKRISSPNERRNQSPKLVVVDVFRRAVQSIKGPGSGTTALAFSPDGTRLAAAYRRSPKEIYIYSDWKDGFDAPVKRRNPVVLSDPDADKSPARLQFSPNGTRLLSTAGVGHVVVWELSNGQSKLVQRRDIKGTTRSICWSPDGSRIVRTWIDFQKRPHGMEVRNADGEVQKEFLFTNLAPLSDVAHAWFVSYIGPEKLLLHTFVRQGEVEPTASVIRFDLKSATGELVLRESVPGGFPVIGAISNDGRLAVMTTSMGLDAIIYRVQEGTIVSRCGAASPVPSLVGWADAGQPIGFAWSETGKRGRNNTQSKDLEFAFDLEKMEPVAEVQSDKYLTARHDHGSWSISKIRGEAASNEFFVTNEAKTIGQFSGGNSLNAATLVPRNDGPPLVAWSAQVIRSGTGTLVLSKADGALVTTLLPKPVNVRDICSSADGRYLIVSTGMHRICLYTTDGAPFPLLSIAKVRGEWVAWSREGYYTASPGGEKMIGWAVGNGSEKLATFHTAQKFAKHFRRPDLLRRAVELGSMDLALKQIETRAPQIEQILPPRCHLKLIRQDGNHLQIQATATSEVKDRPVIAMRVVLDGRPLPLGVGQKILKEGELPIAAWDLDIPPGRHELRLLARNSDSSAESEPLVVKGAKLAGQQPVLHRICIGIDQYQLPALNLTSAVKDARDVYLALEKNCVGIDNRFGKAEGTLLVNQNVTRTAALDVISKVRAAAKPGDLVVVHFAGHGLKQKDEYYLLTHEANPNENLKGKSLSGSDLQVALAEIECPVLLLMDACHSASAVKAFRPATDDLSRELPNGAGVVVLGAAMAHEVASATEENGHFTAAFLKALRAGKDVPYDSYDHVLYAHNIFNVIHNDVRKATKGKQNPTYNPGDAMPQLAVREVP